MAIYDSTNSSSALHLILSSVLPNRHRVRVTSQMDSMVTSKATAVSGTSFGKTALTWTACVGLSLILLQYVGSRREKGIADGNEEDSAGSVGIGPGTLYQFVFEQLSRLRYWIISSSDRDDYDRDEDLDGESLVVHQGSCHCGAVAFEVSAPRLLHVQELSGKLLYPSVRVPESAFRLLRGEDDWQTYHVTEERTNATQAFSFCRNCAVHLVHAIDTDPFMVSFNVHCLTTPWKKAKTRSLGLPALRRGNRTKKRTLPASSPSTRSKVTSEGPGTPNSRGLSPPPSPISFDSRLTDSPTPPPEEDKLSVDEVVNAERALPFFGKEQSLSVTSDTFNSGGHKPKPYALKRELPNPRFQTSASVTEWPTDTTADTSSDIYADDENSLYGSSVASTKGSPLPPTVGGTPRSAGISSDYALREKLRSRLSKHMKSANSA